MVRLRQRYMLCELTHILGDKFRVCSITQGEIEQAVRAQLTKSYGVYGKAVCRDACIRYFHAPTGMVIFRFAPKGQKMFGGAVALTNIGDFHLTILQVAGTTRTVNKKLIQILREDIARAPIVFPRFEDARAKLKDDLEQLEQLESGETAVKY